MNLKSNLSQTKNKSSKKFTSWQEIVDRYPINLEVERAKREDPFLTEEEEIAGINYARATHFILLLSQFNLGIYSLKNNHTLSSSNIHLFLGDLLYCTDFKKGIIDCDKGISIMHFTEKRIRIIIDHLHEKFKNFFNLLICINKDHSLRIVGYMNWKIFLDHLEKNYEKHHIFQYPESMENYGEIVKEWDATHE